MQIIEADILICGAGPAGSACAIMLANSGKKVVLTDKSTFPRDKTCGDALSIDVINQLSILSPELLKEFTDLKEKVPSYGIRIFAPGQEFLDIPFVQDGKLACGYISPRLDFDNLLFNHAKKQKNIIIFEQCTVEKITISKDEVIAFSADKEFHAPLIIGADGAHSIVAKTLGNFKVDKKHYTAGLRVYYENVKGLDQNNLIELHFIKELLPGYLWIFPLPNNKANVGIGMLSSVISSRKINLRDTLKQIIQGNTNLAERFKGATPLESVKGFGLPLGSKKRAISGERFLLAGDAASMIDPLSGEGIGNAIRCGRIAAEHALACLEKKDYSVAFNKRYDKEVYSRMWKELRISRIMQKVFSHGWFLNIIVKNANRSPYLKHILTGALGNSTKKKYLLLSPKFYYELFRKKQHT